MRTWIGGILLLFSFALPAAAQDTPLLDVGGGYSYVRANAPPMQCGCFNMNGGFGTFAVNANNFFGFASDVSVVHAGNINGSGIGLTLISYTFGPRISLRNRSRFTPFGDMLIGGATAEATHGSSTSWALNVGGGLDMNLTHKLALRLIEVDYFYTHFPNGINDHQDNLRMSAGLIFHLSKK